MLGIRIIGAARRGRAWIALGVAAYPLWAGTLPAISAQGPPAQPPAQQAQAAPTPRVFGSDAALVINFVKADKTADFEAVIAKLKEALQKSERPERKQQATGWKVFKAAEPGPAGSAVYVFVINPPLKGADYTVSTLLAEAFPAEAQALSERYVESLAPGQTFINLTLLPVLRK